MKPPNCDICHDPSKMETCKLIYFKRSESDKKWDKKVNDNPGFVGHPPYAVWFCEDHYKIAEKYSHLTRSEAMEKIKKELH